MAPRTAATLACMSSSGSTAASSTRPTRRSARSTTGSSTVTACGNRSASSTVNFSRLAHHLELLFSAAEAQGIDIPLSRDELAAAIEATVRANNRTEGYVRVIVTRGPGTLGPDPRKIDAQVIIIAEEYQPFPLELYAHGLHAVTVRGSASRLANSAVNLTSLWLSITRWNPGVWKRSW